MKQNSRSDGREDGLRCVKGFIAYDGCFLGLWNHHFLIKVVRSVLACVFHRSPNVVLLILAGDILLTIVQSDGSTQVSTRHDLV